MDDRVAKIGMTFFVATEIMFFAGLISAYWVLRSQIIPWPPIDQPRLPVIMTGLNTLVLLFSAVSISFADHASRRLNRTRFLTWLQVTATAGLIFLAIQGYEWERLIRFGMRTTKNIYGGLFYIIIGAHAVHLAVALMALIGFILKGWYRDSVSMTGLRIYWTFVVLIWPILYGLVYF